MIKILFTAFTFILMISSSFAYDLSFEFFEKRIVEIVKVESLINTNTLNFQINGYEKLNQSLETFSEYNIAQLKDIDNSLDGTNPIYGNELTYLSKSFALFNRYYKTLEKIEDNIKDMKNAKKKSVLEISIKVKKMEMLFENYFPTLENKTMRRAINEDDLTYDVKVNDFRKILLKTLKRRTYKRIKKLSKKLPRLDSIIVDSLAVKNLVEHVRNSALLKTIAATKYKDSKIKKDKKKIRTFLPSDRFSKIKEFLFHHLSGAFGNLAGSVRWRYGTLLHNEKIIQEILMQLKPLDIITEKTWFAATDTFIPGHFGHNAIWLGTKEQLIENGMWLHPEIVKVHSEIEAGKSILESDRSGTHLKDLRTFMNVDEFAILKIKNLEEKPAEYIEYLYTIALGQLGKTYDFNFDVETTDKLVCSELLYQVYGDIKWPTKSILGRFTITPDNVTSLALYQNSPIELAYYVAQRRPGIGNLRYKNLDDLADDMGFRKSDVLYQSVTKECTGKGEKMICKETIEPVIYVN